MTARDPDLRLVPPPVDGQVLATTRRQRLVVLAHDARDLYRFRDFVRGMAMGGHDLVLAWLDGELPLPLPGRHLRIRSRLVHSPLGLVRQVVTTPLGSWTGDRSSLLVASRLDPDLQQALADADALVALGDRARGVAAEVAGHHCPVVPHDDLRGWASLARTWRQLRGRVRERRLSASYARNLAARVRILGGVVPAESQGDLTLLLEELLRSGGHEAAVELLPHLDLGEDPVERARRRALAAALRTSAQSAEDPDLRLASAELLSAADRVLADGDLSRAAALAALALRLLFHPELHSDTLSTPLVEEPERFLAAWTGSSVGRVLATAGERPAGRRPARHHERPTVVVVPGSYPRFSAQVSDALTAQAHTEVVDVAARPHLRGLGVRDELVDARLREALGAQAVLDEELRGQLASADALFVDWVDRGALVALMTVPEGVRVTVRIHSMDALSAWIHLVDWSRVDDLVFVSRHVRDLVLRLLGERLLDTRVHVVPNSVDPGRVTELKSPGHRRRILMIGWGQRVKDPVWALEVLARLRVVDPAWRLVLVGPDFSASTSPARRQEALRFRRRLARPDVSEAVVFVGETYDLVPHLEATGFVLSSSRRESCPVGLLEGAASGAVPVVRNWPLFASLDGARRLFPSDWVVDTVEEAAARILEHAEAAVWDEASDRVRAEVGARFMSTPGRLVAVILGHGDD